MVVNTTIQTNEDVLFFAFRYALGRRTAAVSIVADALIGNVHALKLETRSQIIEEIQEQDVRYGGLGDDCDKEQWGLVRKALRGEPVGED